MNFGTTGLSVLLLVALCVPGFLLMKAKLLKEQHIGGLSVLLLYVCSPALSLYSFQQADYTPALLANMGIVFLAAVVAQLLILGVACLIFRKRFDDPTARVASVASAFGNVGFFGMPVLQALLPDHPEAVVYSAVFIVSMNLIGWTLGMFIISRDKKYVAWKKFLFNPVTLGLVVALPLFFTGTKLPDALMTWVTFFGRMSTPVAMTVLGMRMATVRFKELFTDYKHYVAIILKLVIMPLIAYLVMIPIDMDATLKVAIFILMGMPPAAVTLNYAEITGTSPKTAADIVIMGSLLCVLTLPLLLLLA